MAKNGLWIIHLRTYLILFRECRAGNVAGAPARPAGRPHRSPLLVPPAALRHPGAPPPWANHTRQSGRQDGAAAIAAKAVALVFGRSQKIHPQTQSETSQKSCHTGPRVSAVGRPEDRLRPVPMPSMDPGLRGCQEIDGCLDLRCASFETAASRPPQDEEFS
jgi:hypothetical protein